MTLAAMQSEIAAAFAARGSSMRSAMRSIKALFVALGAAVAGAAQFVTLGATPTPVQITGVAATIVAFIGAVIVVVVDEDAGEQLALAHRALESARDAERQVAGMREVYGVVDRMIGLYQATGTIRSVLEQIPSVSALDDAQIVDRMLQAAGRSLVIASGFSQQDQWTIAVYMAESGSPNAKMNLRCVAHRRAIECELSSARVWPEGVGVAGVAFSNKREVVVEDLSDESLQSVFQPAGLVKDYDDDRYRSIVAVPVSIGNEPHPWGVVCATSDRVAHFNHRDAPGLKHEEAIRSFAGFIALAVTVVRSTRSAAARNVQSADQPASTPGVGGGQPAFIRRSPS